jgi:hypothetical protein
VVWFVVENVFTSQKRIVAGILKDAVGGQAVTLIVCVAVAVPEAFEVNKVIVYTPVVLVLNTGLLEIAEGVTVVFTEGEMLHNVAGAGEPALEFVAANVKFVQPLAGNVNVAVGA